MGTTVFRKGLWLGAVVVISLVAGWITAGLTCEMWFVADRSRFFTTLAIVTVTLPSIICFGLCLAMPWVTAAACYVLSLSCTLQFLTRMKAEVWAALLFWVLAPFLCGCGGVALRRLLRPSRLPGGEPKCPACGYVLYYAHNRRCPECGRPFQFREVSLQHAEIRDEVLYPKDRSPPPRDVGG